jgi:hypothetical protein
MKVKVTATITYETELLPEHYEAVEADERPTTDDEIIAYELADLDGEYASSLEEGLMECGELSDIKIEKLEETAAPAAEEAA